MSAADCTCRPSDGHHQYHCFLSIRHRIESAQRGTPPPSPDELAKRAPV